MASSGALQLEFSDNYQDYTQRLMQWQKVRDCIEGEDAVKLRGESYLPKPSGQDADEYKSYKARASFYGVAERTLRGLTGMVFRNDPVLELPERLEPMRDCLTTEGYSFLTLCSEVVREVLSIGRYGILIDFPTTAGPTQPPYFASYFCNDITDWETKLLGAKIVLTKVLLRERALDKSGENEERYRELCLVEGVYTQRIWKTTVEKKDGNQSGGKRNYVLEEESTPMIAGKTLDYIPFVFFNPYDLRPEIEKPPFLDLCNVNLAHFRNSADYEHALFMTAQPTPWCSGAFNENNMPTAIGPHALWVMPEGAQAGMLEFTGAGIAAQETAMERKEERMAALGARMIVESKVRNEASDTARMRGKGETSLLVSAVKSVEEGLDKLFTLAAQWMSANEEDVKIKLNRDFVEARMEPSELDSLVKAWQSGAISRTTLHENLQRGEIVPGDRDAEEEEDLIETEEMDTTVPEVGTAEEQQLTEERMAPDEEES